MEQLWPVRPGSPDATVSELDLLSLYAYPEPLTVPYVRVNLACTANGKVAIDGRSAGLGSAADKLLFGRLRRLTDVILVGAGTVRADDCRGARKRADVQAFRRERGQSEVPPIAVVTGSASIGPDCRLFTDTYVPPIIFTTSLAPKTNVARLRDAGADVATVGEEHVDIDLVLEELAKRGLYRVLCEGGPTLFGSLIAANAVDELCLTMAPLIGGTTPLSTGPEVDVASMRLLSVLAADETLLLRYQLERDLRPTAA
jgi:riboflavin-specific deaminase-like protein